MKGTGEGTVARRMHHPVQGKQEIHQPTLEDHAVGTRQRLGATTALTGQPFHGHGSQRALRFQVQLRETGVHVGDERG